MFYWLLSLNYNCWSLEEYQQLMTKKCLKVNKVIKIRQHFMLQLDHWFGYTSVDYQAIITSRDVQCKDF